MDAAPIPWIFFISSGVFPKRSNKTWFTASVSGICEIFWTLNVFFNIVISRSLSPIFFKLGASAESNFKASVILIKSCTTSCFWLNIWVLTVDHSGIVGVSFIARKIALFWTAFLPAFPTVPKPFNTVWTGLFWIIFEFWILSPKFAAFLTRLSSYFPLHAVEYASKPTPSPSQVASTATGCSTKGLRNIS